MIHSVNLIISIHFESCGKKRNAYITIYKYKNTNSKNTFLSNKYAWFDVWENIRSSYVNAVTIRRIVRRAPIYSGCYFYSVSSMSGTRKKDSPKKLNPTKTAIPDAGAKYEVSVATLVAAILSNNEHIENYHVFTNLKEASPFDDVVAKVIFKGEDTPYAFALQSKHIGKGETLDVEKYVNGYNKIFDAGGFKTIGNIDVANIHFSYLCVNKVKKADNYTLHMHNPASASWRSTLLFPNCHILTYNKPINKTEEDFLNNFHLYLFQTHNNIKENIKNLCKVKDISGISNYVDRFSENDVLWKRGLCKQVFQTELLKIRLSDYIIPPTDIIQLHDLQTAIWNKLVLQYNATIVRAEANIEKSLYGSCAQALNRLLNNSVDWDVYKTNSLDSTITDEFKRHFAEDISDKVRHWIEPPTTLKSLIIELWKCGELSLILRSDENLPALKDYASLNKNYIIVTENVANKRAECDSYQLRVFTHVSDIKCPEMRDELLNSIPVSLQGREPITLHSIIARHEELATTLSCSHIINLMKTRQAYLSRECLEGDHNMIFLIEDSTCTAEYNIDNINKVIGNITIRCPSENITRYRSRIKENPHLKNCRIYHCVTSSKNENFTLVTGDKSILKDFFVDQDGEDVYLLEDNPIPIIGPSLKCIRQNYIPRFLRGAVVSKSIFDSPTKGICFFSGGDFSYLEKKIRTRLMDAPKDIKFKRENVLIDIRNEDLKKYWEKASNLKCPLLHVRVDGASMQLCRCKNWGGLSEHILYGGRKIPEESVLAEITNGITILAGEPGIGKSSLLQSLFKSHALEKYIIFYNLVDYGRFLAKQKLVPTNISLDFLLDQFKSKQYKEFQSALFGKKERLLVLLDSFDEILPVHKEKALYFIRNLAASNVKIIIASRIIANHILMGNFETRILKVDSLGPHDRKEYIRNCGLNIEILTTIPDEFSKNPLYLNLLKTIAENNVNLERFSRLALFENIIRIKLDQYFETYFLSDHLFDKDHHLKPVLKLHLKLALVRILGADVVERLLGWKYVSELPNPLKLGIILSIGDDCHPTFAHETFAEYLAADWIVRNKAKSTAKNVYQEILKQNKLHILNILCEHLELHKAVLEQNEEQIEMYAGKHSHLKETDALGRMAIHVAAAHCNWLSPSIGIIIRYMRQFKVNSLASDDLMGWDWVQHINRDNDIDLKLCNTFSTSALEAYLNCIVQKLQSDAKLRIHNCGDPLKNKIYIQALETGNIDMIRDLLFVEDAISNGVSQASVHRNCKASEADSLNLIQIRQWTPLHVACIYGNIEAVRELIKLKHSVNAGDKFGCTPMHYSVINPPKVSFEMTKLLLENGSKVDIVNRNERTALDISVLAGNINVTQLLLEKNAVITCVPEEMLKLLLLAVNRKDRDMVELLLKYQTATDNITKGFMHACSDGNSEIVELFLEKGADVNSATETNETPLMLASKQDNIEVVASLLKNGANVDSATKYGKTPLMFAIEEGNLGVVDLLLKNGVNVNNTYIDAKTLLIFATEKSDSDFLKVLLGNGADVNSPATDGGTPLMLACGKGDLNIVKLLLENGANVNCTTTDGKPLIIFATEEGYSGIVEALLENGANVNCTATSGKTPLMFACEKGNLDMAKLLSANLADVNWATTIGKTSLMFACENGNLDTVKLLLKNGAIVNTETTEGETALMFASKWDHSYNIVKLLIEEGANVNWRTTNGKTPLMFACENGNLDTIKLLLENDAIVNHRTTQGETALIYASKWYHSYNVIKLLLGNGADVNCSTTNAETPLMFACEKGNLDIVKLLLENGADITCRTRKGETALTYASRWYYPYVAESLLKIGAKVDSPTTIGKTPLMFACEIGNLNMVKLLLENGANINSKTTDAESPLMFACEKFDLNIVKLLLKKGANINYKTTTGKTALTFFCEKSNFAFVKLLLVNGVEVDCQTANGKTPLMLACEKGDSNIVKLLLENSADVNSVSINGETPLMFACQKGNLGIVRLLLKIDIDVNCTTRNGETALMFACEKGDTDTARLLIDNGANVNCNKTDGKTPLMSACENRNLNIIELLLKNGANINCKTTKGETALMFACEKNYIDIAAFLLANGVEVNCQTANGKTPLMLACEKGDSNIVKLLLENIADVNSVSINGETPLMFACQKGNLGIVRLLLKIDIDVNCTTRKGETALMFACEKSDTDTAMLLIDNGANVNCNKTNGKTPLMSACENRNLNIIELLLKNGANINCKTTKGETPLMFACEKNYIDTAAFLLKNGANVNCNTISGKTLVISACEKGNLEIVILLLENGADVNCKTASGKTAFMFVCEKLNQYAIRMLLPKVADINRTTTMGKTALMFACEKGSFRVVKLLFDNGADINRTTVIGKSALMFACEKGNFNAVKLVLEKGADINCTTTMGKTALMFACENSYYDIIKLQLENNADINRTTMMGKTALMFACEKGNFNAVKLLLDIGADINWTTTIGETAFMFACKNGNFNIIRLLLERGADANFDTINKETPLIFPEESVIFMS